MKRERERRRGVRKRKSSGDEKRKGIKRKEQEGVGGKKESEKGVRGERCVAAEKEKHCLELLSRNRAIHAPHESSK